MNLYLVASTALLLLGGVIWERKDVYNAFIKIILLAAGGYGLFVTLQQFGYILHK